MKPILIKYTSFTNQNEKYKYIQIVDSSFLIDKQRAKRILSSIIDENLNIDKTCFVYRSVL